MEDYDFIARLWKAKIPFVLIQKDVVISVRKYKKTHGYECKLPMVLPCFYLNKTKALK
jgi:hypothetical protein